MFTDHTSNPASARHRAIEVPWGWKPKMKEFIP